MSNTTNTPTDQATQQFENLLFGPARHYANLTISYTEELLAAQFDTAKAFSELGLSRARAALDIKDAESLRTYVEGQQQAAKALSERIQTDLGKVVAMNKEFAREYLKLVEDNAKTIPKANADNVVALHQGGRQKQA